MKILCSVGTRPEAIKMAPVIRALRQRTETVTVCSGQHTDTVRSVLDWFAIEPDIVLAQGDTTTVMVTAVSCLYRQVSFGHIEAGLWTGDLSSPFPEEFNRVVAGRVARWHFCPTERANSPEPYPPSKEPTRGPV